MLAGLTQRKGGKGKLTCRYHCGKERWNALKLVFWAKIWLWVIMSQMLCMFLLASTYTCMLREHQPGGCCQLYNQEYHLLYQAISCCQEQTESTHFWLNMSCLCFLSKVFFIEIIVASCVAFTNWKAVYFLSLFDSSI
jgi:hypothetical protein